MKVKSFVLLLMLATSSSMAIAESYVCTPETAASLINIGNKWQVLPYDDQLPNVQKYVIKITKQPSTAALFDQETNQKLFDCAYWFPEISAATCEDGGNSIFKFLGDPKTRTGKYTASGIGSEYLFGRGVPTGTKKFSTIEQGKCLKVD